MRSAGSGVVSLSCVCITAKPGVCPRRRFGAGMCAEFCVNDSDCPNNDKCCSNGCGHECSAPYTGMNSILCTCMGQLPRFLSICVLFLLLFLLFNIMFYTGMEIMVFVLIGQLSFCLSFCVIL